MRIKVIHSWMLVAALLASVFAVVPSLSADPVRNHSMTPAARRARQSSAPNDDVFLSPLGIAPPPRKVAGFFFHRASDKGAPQLLAEAARVEATGDWAGAISIYDKVVRSYPYLIESAEAQLHLARLEEKLGRYKDAFEEYRYLLHYYPENAPADAILKQMFAIAAYYESRGDESRAMDYFRKITDIAPKWRHTASALNHLGRMQIAKKKYLDAAATFDAVMTGYPGSDAAVKASVGFADARYAIAGKYPEDDGSQLRAITALQTALVLVEKDSPDHGRLADRFEELVARRFDRHFRMATFYDSPRFSTETKIAAYEDFIRRFPHAPQVETARARLAELGPRPPSVPRVDNRKTE